MRRRGDTKELCWSRFSYHWTTGTVENIVPAGRLWLGKVLEKSPQSLHSGLALSRVRSLPIKEDWKSLCWQHGSPAHHWGSRDPMAGPCVEE